MRKAILAFLMGIVLSTNIIFMAYAEKETIKMKVGDQEIDMEFSLSEESML